MLFQIGFRHHSVFPLFRFFPSGLLSNRNNPPPTQRKMSQKVLKRFTRFGTALAKAADVIDAREEPVPIPSPPSEVSAVT